MKRLGRRRLRAESKEIAKQYPEYEALDRRLPGSLFQAHDEVGRGQLTHADAAHAEFSQIPPGSAAEAAAVIDAGCKFWFFPSLEAFQEVIFFSPLFDDQAGFCHRGKLFFDRCSRHFFKREVEIF